MDIIRVQNKCLNPQEQEEGGMSIFSKELKINNTFEVILDNGTDQSSSEKELEKKEE